MLAPGVIEVASLTGCPAGPSTPAFEAPAAGTIHVRATERGPAPTLGSAFELCPAEGMQLQAWVTDRGREWRRMKPVAVAAGEVVRVVFELDEAQTGAALYAARGGSASPAFEPIPDAARPATKHDGRFTRTMGTSSSIFSIEPVGGKSRLATTWILGPGPEFTQSSLEIISIGVEGKDVAPAEAPFPVWELHLGWAPLDPAGAGRAETR